MAPVPPPVDSPLREPHRRWDGIALKFTQCLCSCRYKCPIQLILPSRMPPLPDMQMVYLTCESRCPRCAVTQAQRMRISEELYEELHYEGQYSKNFSTISTVTILQVFRRRDDMRPGGLDRDNDWPARWRMHHPSYPVYYARDSDDSDEDS